jgi:hypothetical protein
MRALLILPCLLLAACSGDPEVIWQETRQEAAIQESTRTVQVVFRGDSKAAPEQRLILSGLANGSGGDVRYTMSPADPADALLEIEFSEGGRKRVTCTARFTSSRSAGGVKMRREVVALTCVRDAADWQAQAEDLFGALGEWVAHRDWSE